MAGQRCCSRLRRVPPPPAVVQALVVLVLVLGLQRAPLTAAALSIGPITCPAAEVDVPPNAEVPSTPGFTYRLLGPGTFNLSSFMTLSGNTTCYVGVGASRDDVVVLNTASDYTYMWKLVNFGLLGLQGLTIDGQGSAFAGVFVRDDATQLALHDVTLQNLFFGILTNDLPPVFSLTSVRLVDCTNGLQALGPSIPRQYLWRDIEAVRNTVGLFLNGVDVTINGAARFINNTMYGAQLVSGSNQAALTLTGPAVFRGNTGNEGPAVFVSAGSVFTASGPLCLQDNVAGSAFGAINILGSAVFSCDPLQQVASGNSPGAVFVNVGGSFNCSSSAASNPRGPGLYIVPSGSICSCTDAGGLFSNTTCSGCPADSLWAPANCACLCTSGPCCGTDGNFLTSTTVCRPRTSECDTEDRCDGTRSSCQPDASQPDGTSCHWFRHHTWAHPFMHDASSLQRVEVSEVEALAQLQARRPAADGSYSARSKACRGHCRAGRCTMARHAPGCCSARHHPDTHEDYVALLGRQQWEEEEEWEPGAQGGSGAAAAMKKTDGDDNAASPESRPHYCWR